MFSKEQVDMLMKKAMSQLGLEESDEDKGKKNGDGNKDKNSKKKSGLDLSTSQILVIIALLGNALDVDSFLIDKEQQIQIVLTGSLKQKTEMEKIMDEVGKKPFDEVMKTILGRY